MPDWGFEVGVNTASWFKRGCSSSSSNMDQQTLTILNPNIIAVPSSLSSAPKNASSTNGAVITVNPRSQDRSTQGQTILTAPPGEQSFRASGLRYTLRFMFQLLILGLTFSNISFQFKAFSHLEQEFNFFLCRYAVISLLIAVGVFGLHLVLCVICFVAYMKLNSRTYYSITAYNTPPNLTFSARRLQQRGGGGGGNHLNIVGSGSGKQIERLHHLAFLSSVLALLHHILCHFMFALLYCAITFIKAGYLSSDGDNQDTLHQVLHQQPVQQQSSLLSFVSATTPLTLSNVQPSAILFKVSPPSRDYDSDQLFMQRTFVAQNKDFSLALALTVMEVIIHWCQSWVVYLWKKPCCYFAEKLPSEEKNIYDEAGVIKGLQIFFLPLISLIIFSSGATSLAFEKNLNACHAFIVALWLSTLMSIPFLMALVLLPIYFCLKIFAHFLKITIL